MKRIVGIFTVVLVLYLVVLGSGPSARSVENHRNLGNRLALYGVMTVGVGTLIISGGIDLSIGSVVALSAIVLGQMLRQRVPESVAVGLVLVGAVAIGTIHGLLVTMMRLQPFVVTLCGLFIYRGMAYWFSMPSWPEATEASRAVGIGGRASELAGLMYLSTGSLSGVPVRLWLLLGLTAVAAVFLHRSVYGRYLYAIGSNEQAARYAGLQTDRYKILAYIICSVCAALAGMMEFLELQTALPSNAGNFYELYAITGAVLGGCSLRGGEGTVIGMLLGTAVLPLLRNLINFSNLGELEFMVIGGALLLGTISDELLRTGQYKKLLTLLWPVTRLFFRG